MKTKTILITLAGIAIVGATIYFVKKKKTPTTSNFVNGSVSGKSIPFDKLAEGRRCEDVWKHCPHHGK